MKAVVALCGDGISAKSGVRTFRIAFDNAVKPAMPKGGLLALPDAVVHTPFA
jgi:hypothetical protein